MTLLEACRQVISEKKSKSDSSLDYGIWREFWPQDMILGFNDKKDAYVNSPGVSVYIDDSYITSRCLVLSLSSTGISYVGWLPSIDDLTATDWQTNVPQNTTPG
jgi:hypothetical protein